MDFYLYVNLALHTDFTYRFITYGFYIRIHCIQIYYLWIKIRMWLHIDPNLYVITYGF